MAAARPLTRAYLDYNATAPLRPQAREAMLAALEAPGNPSSVHAEGRAARALVEEARRDVAALAGVSPRCVTFVSGGCEAAATILNPQAGVARAEAPLARLILAAGEHACVLAGHRFPAADAQIVPLGHDGRVDLGALETALKRADAGRAMVALQGANNETGVVQPVAEAAALARAAGGILVCDAVQVAGRASFDMAALGADFAFLSAHKLGGPKGAGAIVAARPELALGAPLLRGGGQERGARAGTENVAAIAGFGAAARAARADAAGEGEGARLAALRDRLEAAVRAQAADAVVFGETAPRLPNTLCFAIPGLAAATLVIALDLAGVAVSSGSACSSGKVARSHVLEAMGVAPDLASGAIRLSLGWDSIERDVERFADALAQVLTRMRRGRAPTPGAPPLIAR